MKQIEVILVPGLGDIKPIFGWFYAYVAKKWSHHGLPTQVHTVYWERQDGAGAKLDALLKRIDAVHQQGSDVVLVGASAGASLALIAYAERSKKVSKVVSVCGWINADNKGFTHLTNPNLTCREVLLRWGIERDRLSKEDLGKVLAIRPLYDRLVYAHMAHMKGMQNKQVLSVGHLPTIVYVLLGKIEFIKKFIR